MVKIKKQIKNSLPKSVYSGLRKIKLFPKNARLTLAGFYFTYFIKEYKSNGVSIKIPFSLTNFKFRGRFVFDTYEKEEAEYLSKYLSPDATVIELGGCLGFVSCLTNKILNDKTKHLVLEANPNLIPWIEKNKAENSCFFSVENVVITKEKEIPFYIHDLIVGGSLKRKTGNQVSISGATFDSLQKKYDLIFDTLIMDIEGGELELFRNQKEEIAKFKMIFFEVHPFAGILTNEEAQECEDILSQLDFRIIKRDGHFQVWEKSFTNN
ncbi:FkbM family methyltransferase [uncultured Aquimarina sp.]|uniref:FkbM family methyltransferase n=1 Tax=uncultured Aquimarina sp. TaxID=575652 RepID=UPI00262D4E76|nr:FkbM family methyltransferase [uncultured Aquimarina sp.]